MKKISVIILAFIMIFSLFTVCLSAEGIYTFDAEYAINRISTCHYYYDFEFKSTNVPPYESYMEEELSQNGIFDKYYSEEDGCSTIPAADVESTATKYFTNKTAIITALREDTYYNYNASDNTYSFNLGGIGGGDPPDCILKGYNSLGDDTFEFYALRAYGPYEPQVGEEKGIDYMFYSYTLYEYDVYGKKTREFDTIRCGKIIDDAVKVVIKDNNGVYEYSSFELVPRDAVPTTLDENFKTKNSITTKTDNVEIVASPLNSDGNSFENVTLKIKEITDEKSLETVKRALNDSVTDFLVFDFTACKADSPYTYDNEPIEEPIEGFKADIEVKVAVPQGYNNPAFYYVSDDGKTVEEITGTVKDGYFIGKLSHLSNYVIANKKVVENNKDIITSPQTGVSSKFNIWISLLILTSFTLIYILKNKLKI